jgi:hypothetical protein
MELVDTMIPALIDNSSNSVYAYLSMMLARTLMLLLVIASLVKSTTQSSLMENVWLLLLSVEQDNSLMLTLLARMSLTFALLSITQLVSAHPAKSTLLFRLMAPVSPLLLSATLLRFSLITLVLIFQ